MGARVRPLALALAAALASGCSLVNDPSAHEQALDPIAPDALCGEIAVVFCDAHVECCESGDRAVCTEWVRAYCNTAFGDTLQDPRTGYDPERAAEALARARFLAETCDPALTDWLLQRDRGQLLSVFAGTVSSGGQCGMVSEVLQTAIFYSCMSDDESCQLRDLSTLVCRERGREGSECRSHLDCQDELRCEGGGLTAGRCRALLDEGAACESSAECESRVCGGSSPTCLPRTSASVYCEPRRG
jgi:hypothetical protein